MIYATSKSSSETCVGRLARKTFPAFEEERKTIKDLTERMAIGPNEAGI